MDWTVARVARRTSLAVALAGVSLLMVLPIWLTHYPPIQDWPQHLAAVRVLHSYSDPEFGFQEFFQLTPTDTQYLTVYYLASGLAYFVGVTSAVKLVLSLAIVALPIAMYGLARALGRSGATAFLALPLVYNAHTILGFINFVAALPLMMAVLTLAVRQRSSPSKGHLWLLAALLICCFYTHVVPFAIALLGSVLVMATTRAISWRRLLPLAIVALGVLPWFGLWPAGQSVLAAVGLRAASGRAPVFSPPGEALTQAPLWLTDVWRGDWDFWLLAAWVGTAVSWLLVAAVSREAKPVERDQLIARRVLLALPIVCLGAYFLLPASYSWIWPINKRFLLLASLVTAPLIGDPPATTKYLLTVVVGSLALVDLAFVTRAFQAYDREVGDLQRAIEEIPPRSKVAGLIWSRGSQVVAFSPFLHSVAYYQAQRGGAVMFSFADFPQSPFHFREDARPPRVRSRWEWTPERTVPDKELGWYDWLLTRGGPRELVGASEFSLTFSSPPWRVWKRSQPSTE